MSQDDDEIIGGLIAAGIIVAIGYGVYRVIKSFGSFDTGDKIHQEEISKTDITKSYSSKALKCVFCGSTNDVQPCNWDACREYVCEDHRYSGDCVMCDWNNDD